MTHLVGQPGVQGGVELFHEDPHQSSGRSEGRNSPADGVGAVPEPNRRLDVTEFVGERRWLTGQDPPVVHQRERRSGAGQHEFSSFRMGSELAPDAEAWTTNAVVAHHGKVEHVGRGPGERGTGLQIGEPDALGEHRNALNNQPPSRAADAVTGVIGLPNIADTSPSVSLARTGPSCSWRRRRASRSTR